MRDLPHERCATTCGRNGILAVIGLCVVSWTAVRSSEAASQGDVSAMTCSDYLKAEQSSGFTEGVTGKQGMDTLSPAQASRVHDYCASHPAANAWDAILKSR